MAIYRDRFHEMQFVPQIPFDLSVLKHKQIADTDGGSRLLTVENKDGKFKKDTMLKSKKTIFF
jgi:hypothetical protein